MKSPTQAPDVLAKTEGDKSRAAKFLGFSRFQLYTCLRCDSLDTYFRCGFLNIVSTCGKGVVLNLGEAHRRGECRRWSSEKMNSHCSREIPD